MSSLERHDVVYNDGSEEPKTIHYLAAGNRDGPLLIFVHGFPGIGRTWLSQLTAFSSLGFRVVAPDMPGYGKSSASKDTTIYSTKRLNAGLLALLGDTGRDSAIWVAHDWGSAVLSSFVAHYSEKCKAVAFLSVPYRSVELGLDHLVSTVDRDMYPADEYPYGQWDYMRYFEESYEKAVAWFDADKAGAVKIFSSRVPPAPTGEIPPFATVRKNGGMMGGLPKPPSPEDIPFELMLDKGTYEEYVAGMERTGFGPGVAYYMNHKENHAYNSEVPNGGVLEIPILFISSTHDAVCTPGKKGVITEEMRRLCKDLTVINLDANHWMMLEKPEETNAALARFLVEKLPGEWPVSWDGAKV